MIKYLILSILCAFAFNIARAQKDTTTYYLTANGKIAADKDASYFFIKIAPSDSVSSPKLYSVAGFYRDGKKLFNGYSLNSTLPLKLQGASITFFPNGNPLSVRNYKDGEITGASVFYYPNGKFYSKTIAATSTDLTESYLECRDSTGKILTQNGNGDWITFDQSFSKIIEKGRVKNFKQDSIWTINPNDADTYTITFTDGKPAAMEQAPEFPGGMAAFYQFLVKNVKYPKAAKNANIKGRVVVTFVVDRDGSLIDIHVTRGLGSGCDEEALRVMKHSPKWKPATQGGKPVRVLYSVPISFSPGD